MCCYHRYDSAQSIEVTNKSSTFFFKLRVLFFIECDFGEFNSIEVRNKSG